MYTYTYIKTLLLFMYVIYSLLLMFKFAFGKEKVLLVVLIALMIYFVLFSNTFSTFVRTRTFFDKDKVPVPVGAGWSFYLNKYVGGPVVACELEGLQPNGRWGAATRIKDIQAALRQKHLTMTSYPSIENGTLGGWIASGSHGSGGSRWKPNFDVIRVKHLPTGKVFDTHYKDIFNDDTSISECRKYLILEVEVHPVDDVWCKKVAFKLSSVADADAYLHDDSYLCMMQIGRRGTMILMWTPLAEEDAERITHVDPHLGSQFGLWLQADVLSILQSSDARAKEWFHFPVEPVANYESKVRLGDANAFTLEPPMLLTPIGLAFINFEVFVLDVRVSADALFKLCNDLSDMFTHNVKGRCELRGGNGKLFLDFVIVRTARVQVVFEQLLQSLGPQKIRLHKGKAQVDTFPYILEDNLNKT